MSKKQSQLYFWYSQDRWTKKDNKEIKEELKNLGFRKDIKAAIGAGAQGMIPELNLLLIISGSIIASGFLTAIGEDTWKFLKRTLLDFKHRDHEKPKDSEENRFENKGVELIWWIHYGERKMLITLAVTNRSEADKALELLPNEIDKIVSSDSEASRLLWNGNKWNNY